MWDVKASGFRWESMRMLKRIVAVVLGIVSVAVFVLCLGGVAGAWAIKRPARERTERTFAYADRVLGVTSRSLDLAHDNLQKARADLKTIKETSVAPPSDVGKKPGVFDQMVSHALVQHLGPKVREVSDTLGVATDAAI